MKLMKTLPMNNITFFLMEDHIFSTICTSHMIFRFTHVCTVNYRGSMGFGQDSIFSLPGNVGTHDVEDVQVNIGMIISMMINM